MKITLMPGIESISGSIKQNGKRLVFRTFRRANREGAKPETRMYIFDQRTINKRSAPLSDNERAARELFSLRAKHVQHLIDTQPEISRKQAWEIAKSVYY